MYATIELRWFLRDALPAVEAWFGSHGLTLGKHAARRTDFYLPQPGRDDCGIKLREGDIEIKQRLGNPVAFQATPQAAGWLEKWQKWSFHHLARDPQAQQVLSGGTAWLAVEKERIGLKIRSQSNGTQRLYPLKTSLATGLQVEYTRVQLMGETWFTVGVEAFGQSPFSVPQGLLAALLAATPLPPESSLSYPGWLQRFTGAAN